MGWTPEQTLGSFMPHIMAAYRGRIGMLKTIFGSSEAETSTGSIAGKPVSLVKQLALLKRVHETAKSR